MNNQSTDKEAAEMDGYDPLLLPLPFAFGTMSTIGIIGNIIMVIATIKARRMKSPCHIFIASTCLADLFHEIGQYPFIYHFFATTSMVQSHCFYMQLLPLIGASFGNPLILNLGIDRLIAITLPTRYRFLQTIPLTYVSCQFILPVIYTLYILVWAFLTKNESLVQCSVPQSFGNVAFGLLNQMGTAVNVIIVAVYATSFWVLRRSKANYKMRNVFKSIFVTVAIVIFGWFLTLVINNMAPYFTQSDYSLMVISMYAGLTVNFSAMINVFVYYTINSEYREVIKRICGSRMFTAKVNEVSTMHGMADTTSRRKSSATVNSAVTHK